MNGNLVVQKRLVFLHCTEHFGPFWVHSFNGWPREIMRNRATSTCSTASTPCSPSAEGPSVRSPTELERSQSGCRRGRIAHIPGAQNHVLLARRCGRESLSLTHTSPRHLNVASRWISFRHITKRKRKSRRRTDPSTSDESIGQGVGRREATTAEL